MTHPLLDDSLAVVTTRVQEGSLVWGDLFGTTHLGVLSIDVDNAAVV
jgi:hypothetical protein